MVYLQAIYHIGVTKVHSIALAVAGSFPYSYVFKSFWPSRRALCKAIDFTTTFFPSTLNHFEARCICFCGWLGSHFEMWFLAQMANPCKMLRISPMARFTSNCFWRCC